MLIPRAVAYTTGLLDRFFRARLDADFTVGAAKQRAAWNYDCSNPQGCPSASTPADFAGVLVTTDVFGPVNPPVTCPNVLRARPAPAGERATSSRGIRRTAAWRSTSICRRESIG